jgi:putative hydrolase of the HAD superfamily
VTNGSVLAQEAKIAHLGLEALDADAKDAVYVGDHPVNDVQDATDAGLTAIWMRGWQDWPTDMPPTELLVDRLAEVPPMLASL